MALPRAADGHLAPDVPAEPQHAGAPGDTCAAELESLRAHGAERADPVRFAYVAALQRRIAAMPDAGGPTPATKKLAAACADLHARIATRHAQWAQHLPALLARHPDQADTLCRLLEQNDFGALRSLEDRLRAPAGPGPLAGLVGEIERHATEPAPAEPGATAPAPPAPRPPTPSGELRTVQRYRAEFTRMRIGEQLTRSHAGAPDKPGPLNSHKLVLRALQTMHAVSPAYLACFMAHADALLWLDAASPPAGVAPGKTDPAATRPAAKAPAKPAPAKRKRSTTAGKRRPRGAGANG